MYVRTEYAHIRQYVQKLWADFGQKVDLVLHLGMADGWSFYTMERCAFKEGFSSSWWSPREANESYYLGLDDAGKTIRDMTYSEGKDLWENSPMGLQTTVDVDKTVSMCMEVLNKTKGDMNPTGMKNEKRVDIRPHHEAGPFCCGFIYYESLATCRREGLKTKVMFCHVPGESDQQTLDTGRDVVVAMIGSICTQLCD